MHSALEVMIRNTDFAENRYVVFLALVLSGRRCPLTSTGLRACKQRFRSGKREPHQESHCRWLERGGRSGGRWRLVSSGVEFREQHCSPGGFRLVSNAVCSSCLMPVVDPSGSGLCAQLAAECEQWRWPSEEHVLADRPRIGPDHGRELCWRVGFLPLPFLFFCVDASLDSWCSGLICGVLVSSFCFFSIFLFAPAFLPIFLSFSKDTHVLRMLLAIQWRCLRAQHAVPAHQ